MGRTPCCKEAGLKKGAWTADEDQKLIAYIQEHGEGGWRTLPQKAGLQRCGKSCRLRWANYLRPDIKRGEFSTEEEQKIIQLHASLGNKWSAIARHLPKRTDNEIKNYWNTHLKKRLIDKGIDPVTHRQIAPSPTSSPNHNSCNVGEDRTDSHFKPIQRSTSSTSAKLLNRVSAEFAQMQRKELATSHQTPSPCLGAIKALLLNSAKDAITCSASSGGGGSGSGDDSDVEILPSRPISRSSSSRILNKMATKLVPSRSFDLLKNNLSVPSMATTSVSDASPTVCSYNNVDSPISISDFLESIPTSSSACDSYELTENLGMGEDQVNEALTALHQAIELDTPEYPTYTPYELEEFLGNFGGEDGETFNNDTNQSEACDSQVPISVEPTSDFIEKFTNMPFGCSPDEHSTIKPYCYSEKESNGGAFEVNMNDWNDDLDLVNYAMQ
ncbi:transcription factor MYB122 [Manihot esculenta]|uniref:MYB family protein n=1 Tax=Manihot esculenta TaxID=3983 RepID=A0A2C9VQN8_MANES|nr:transcription factor MYB122 [Manihot esculenta]OAY47594.1 hypothetical protein MANES_06G090300v8 [Manihot esculenta]